MFKLKKTHATVLIANEWRTAYSCVVVYCSAMIDIALKLITGHTASDSLLTHMHLI